MSTSTPPTHGAPDKAHTIGMVSLVAFAVGTMVGGGVFALSGIVVSDAGPGSIIAYVLAGIVMMLSAVCFAAVASRAQPGDTGYAPIGTVLSPMWRFITMWAFYIMGVTGIAYVLMSFGSYLKYFIPKMPAIYMALIAAVLLMLLNFGPASIVGKAETVMVGFKIGVLVLLIIFGIVGFAPKEFTDWTPHGLSPIFTTTALLFTAYSGFNVITNMSGHVKNPQKRVPMAIMISLGIVALVYIGVAVALVSSGAASDPNFRDQALSLAAKKLMGGWGAILVTIAACVSTLSGANANLLGSSELLVRMSATGDLPPKIGRLNKQKDPVRAVAITSAIVVVLMIMGIIPKIGSSAMTIIVAFCNVAGVIAMVIVDITAFRMGMQKWSTPGMRLPLRWLIPALAIITALLQIPSLGWWQSLAGTAMVAVGFIIWARRGKYDEDEIARVQAHVANLETPLGRALRKPVLAGDVANPRTPAGGMPLQSADTPVRIEGQTDTTTES